MTIYEQCDNQQPHSRHEWWMGDERLSCDGVAGPRPANRAHEGTRDVDNPS